MNQTAEDTYFFDRDLAYQTALAHNVVELPNGEKHTQICYYDGEPFEHAPDNLIHVPAPRFTEIFVTKPLRLPTKIDASASNHPSKDKLNQKFTSLLRKVRQLRAQKATINDNDFFSDTFFVDPLSAYETALLRYQVNTNHPQHRGLQVCYYAGDEAFDYPPENLVRVPKDNPLDFFVNTRLRLPSAISFPPGSDEDDARATSATFNELLHEVQKQRQQIGHEFATQCRTHAPDALTQTPLRVLIHAHRYLNNELHESAELFKAFSELACVPHTVCEINRMERVDMPWVYKEFLEFNPHIIFNFDYQDSNWLHDDVFNVVWWQNTAFNFESGRKLHWRERDIVISPSEDISAHLRESGAVHIIEHAAGESADYIRLCRELLDRIQQQFT